MRACLSFGSLDSQFASEDSRGARIPPYPEIQLHSFPQESALSVCIERFLVGVAAYAGLSVSFLSKDQFAALFLFADRWPLLILQILGSGKAPSAF